MCVRSRTKQISYECLPELTGYQWIRNYMSEDCCNFSVTLRWNDHKWFGSDEAFYFQKSINSSNNFSKCPSVCTIFHLTSISGNIYVTQWNALDIYIFTTSNYNYDFLRFLDVKLEVALVLKFRLHALSRMNHLCFPFWMNRIKIYKLCHNKQLDLRSEPWAFLRSTQSFKNYQMKVNCFQSFHARATQSPGILWCLLSCDPCVKFFPHLSQTKGRSPVCVLMWLFNVVAPANAREQYPHLNGFLLAWMTAWARSWAGWAKLSEQWPHWYGFFGASLHTWTWSMVLWGKDFLHWPHFHKLSSVMLLNAGWLILVALFCPSS